MDKMLQVLIIGIIVILILFLLFRFILSFLSKTKPEKFKTIQLFLLSLVIEAEKLFGSKTGIAKRSKVYNWLCARIPFLSLFLTKKAFDSLLNKALEEMKEQLSKNENLYEYVYGKKQISDTTNDTDTTKILNDLGPNGPVSKSDEELKE